MRNIGGVCGVIMLLLLTLLYGCRPQGLPRSSAQADSLQMEELSDSLRFLQTYHYTQGTNFIVQSPFLLLEQLPVKELFDTVPGKEHVVVADFEVFPADSVDSVWVKVAQNQEVMGWIRQSEFLDQCVPADSISQAIYLFSHTHLSWFIGILVVFVVFYLIRFAFRRRLPLIFFNDIDSIYPTLLCLIVAIAATDYETMQIFRPEDWQQYYYNPTLSPLRHAPLVNLFVGSLWMLILVFLAVVDDVYARLTTGAALFYLLGLVCMCIFSYFFFILMAHIYVGYFILVAFIFYFLLQLRLSLSYKYRCGKCGHKLFQKGVCPHCGTMNE